MAIHPIEFRDDGTILVRHDEAAHEGVTTLAAFGFARNPDGSPDLNWLSVPCPCPGCDAESFHPVGGGCSPEMVQQLFVLKYQSDDDIPVATEAEARELVREAVAATDGAERWQLGEDAAADRPRFRRAHAPVGVAGAEAAAGEE